MRFHSCAERVNIRLKWSNINTLPLDLFHQQIRVVDTLRSGANFLPPQEDVVRIGIPAVVWAWHGVKRPNAAGVAIQEEEVGAKLLLHDLAQRQLLRPAQIVEVLGFYTGFPQHGNAVLPMDNAGILGEGDWLALVLAAHDGELLGKPGLKAVEDVAKGLVQHLQYLVVMLLDRHLHVQTREFTQVAPGVGVLRAEDGPHLHDALQVRGHPHLLVQLGGLRQAGGLAEVVGAEDAGTAFGLAANQLGGLYLEEPFFVQGLSVELADGRSDAQDGAVSRYSEVQPPVVQPDFLADSGKRAVCVLRSHNFFLRSGGVLQQEGQHGQGAGDAVHPLYLQLELGLGAALHLSRGHCALDIHHTLER
mmetsp:Transcript_11553/g.17071  ORF Transcript_11553/g.17071 Transcript_11553/m.17071 type:complete len:362 (-) Transcript_11553:180-1265(-)